VAVGDGTVVVVVGAVWLGVVALVAVGVALAAVDVALPLGGDVVQPDTNPATTTRPAATRRIPIP
jgi:hypothetical protein